MGAWGIGFVEVTLGSIAFLTTILGWVLTAAFFGAVAATVTRNERITGKLIWQSVRRFTIGIVIITMVYTIPPLLLIPILAMLVPVNLEANTAVIVIGIGPTVVPSIVAMWSLVVRNSKIVDAVIDGVRTLRGKWLTAIVVGMGYQSLALGALAVRTWLLESDLVLTVAFEAIWVAVEASLRLGILLWLFSEVHSRFQTTTADSKA